MSAMGYGSHKEMAYGPMGPSSLRSAALNTGVTAGDAIGDGTEDPNDGDWTLGAEDTSAVTMLSGVWVLSTDDTGADAGVPDGMASDDT